MSVLTLERTRIRVLKEILRDGYSGRRLARAALEAARLNGGEWRTQEVLNSDFPGMLESSRFLRRVAAKLRDPKRALNRLESLIAQDESNLRRRLNELQQCLLQSDTPRARQELDAFLLELACIEQGTSLASQASGSTAQQTAPVGSN